MTIIGFDWVSKKHLISIATKPVSLLTRTHALMNVPYGNPHGPIVDCRTLHFSIPLHTCLSDCINLYSALLYLSFYYYLMMGMVLPKRYSI